MPPALSLFAAATTLALALTAACGKAPSGPTACDMAGRVASSLARCPQADQRAVEAMRVLAATPSKAPDGSAIDPHHVACAKATLELHHVAFAAGCAHALSLGELGMLEELVGAASGSGSGGSASGSAGSATPAAR